MGQVLRTTQAHLDLVEIAVYLYQHNPSAADRILHSIESKCRQLSDFPEIGRKREELASGLRSFPAGNYIIFYRPRPNGIEVIRVLHGARDLPSLLTEE
jgi:toxin ParE1/3/4